MQEMSPVGDRWSVLAGDDRRRGVVVPLESLLQTKEAGDKGEGYEEAGGQAKAGCTGTLLHTRLRVRDIGGHDVYPELVLLLRNSGSGRTW